MAGSDDGDQVQSQSVEDLKKQVQNLISQYEASQAEKNALLKKQAERLLKKEKDKSRENWTAAEKRAATIAEKRQKETEKLAELRHEKAKGLRAWLDNQGRKGTH